MTKIFTYRLPLRFLIAVPFTLLIFSAVGLTGFLSYRNGQKAVNRLVVDLNREATARTEQVLDNYLSTPILINHINLDAIRLGTLETSHLEANESYFLAQLRQFGNVISIAYANEQREYIGPAREVLGVDLVVGLSSQATDYSLGAYKITSEGDRELISTLPDYDPRARPWYQVAEQAGRQVWTPIYLWASGDAGIDAVAPVYSLDNKFIGVLSSSLTLNAIGEYLQGLKISDHGQSFIIDMSGYLVASSTIRTPFKRAGEELQRLSVLEVEDPVVQAAVRALEQEAGNFTNINHALSLVFNTPDETYYAQAAPYRDNYGLEWLIVTIIPESDFMAQIHAGNRQTGMLIGLSLLASGLLAALISLVVTRPIAMLNDYAKALAGGELSRRVNVDRKDEIGELSKSFNDMAHQLQASFLSIQASEQRYEVLFEESPISLWELDGSTLKNRLDELSKSGITDLIFYFTEHPEEIQNCTALIKINDVNRASMAIMGAETKDAFSKGLVTIFTEITYEFLGKALAALTTEKLVYQMDTICRTLKGYEINVHLSLGVLSGFQDTWAKMLLSMVDITQRQQAENELRLSEARYRAVVENQTEFIVRWKPDGTRTFTNEAYRRYFNLTPEQAVSSGFIPLVAEEDRVAVEGKMSRLLSGMVTTETEIHRVIKPDGNIGWQEWVDQAIYNETGKIVEFQSVGRDITERKRAEEIVRESEAIYRQAIEAVGAVPYRQTYLAESNHVDFDFIGEGIFQITGYGAEVFNAHLWDSLIKETHLLGDLAHYPWKEAVQRVRSGEIPVWKCEYLIQSRDGTMRWVFESAVELRDEHGVSHGSIGLYQDITERKRAEEALREKTDELERFFNSALDLLCIADTDGYFRRLNHEWENVLGYRLEDLEGKSYLDLVHPDDMQATLNAISKLEAQVEVLDFTNRYRCKDGTYRWIEWRAIPFGNQIYGTARNVTERVQTEEKLRVLTRRLVAAQEEERKRIAQELHDELGQALTAISLDLGSIEKTLPQEIPSEIKERLIDARSLADEVDERISELALDLRPSLLDDLGLLPTLRWYLERYSQRLGVKVTTNFAGLENRLPDEIETSLYRVIQEALTNIARHAQAGNVQLSLEHSAAGVAVNIQDDGRGFDIEAAQSLTDSPDSLGLFGIKDRVSTLGGRVEIDSTPGQGVHIRIWIPM